MKCIDEYYASSYHLSVEELNNINVHLASGLVKVDGLKKESGRARFWCKDGFIIVMCHHQDCCEGVWIEDVDSEENNSDIYTDCEWCKLEEINSDDNPPLDKWDESYTWTFYKITTNKGYDTIRWYGTSNGYYSESVDFELWQYEDYDLVE